MKQNKMKKSLLLLVSLLCVAAVFTACGKEKEEENDPQYGYVIDYAKPAGLYAQVLDDLYAKDPALNEDIDIVAFDLSKCYNLTDEEKNSLMVITAAKWDKMFIQGTFEQLKLEGHITTDENGGTRFDRGILITIETDESNTPEAGKKEFTFSAGKYRSSLGAYYFTDCTGTFNGKDWTYTIGAEAIS